MKKILFALASFALLQVSCNDKWDEHYEGGEQFASNDNTEVVNKSVAAFLSETTDFSKFTEEFNVIEDLVAQLSRDQKVTIWAVDNAAYDADFDQGWSDDYKALIMRYHANLLEFKFQDLKDGQRILTLSDGVYHDINWIEDLSRSEGGKFYVNYDELEEENSYITKSYQLTNGTVHVVSKLLIPKISLFEYIPLLPAEYSTFRDTLLNINYMKFIVEKSTPIGVDQTGNTIYDSVKEPWNPIFDVDKGNLNYSDKSKNITMIIPSNAAMENYWAKAKQVYKDAKRTMTKADTLFVFQWIKEAIFFTGTEAAKLVPGVTADVNSHHYKRIWRPTVQVADYANVQKFNNGKIFFASDVKMPNYEVLRNAWKELSSANANETYPYQMAKGWFHGRPGDLGNVPTDALAFYDEVAEKNIPGDSVKMNGIWPRPEVPAGKRSDWFGNPDTYKHSKYGWIQAMPYLSGFAANGEFPNVWGQNYSSTSDYYTTTKSDVSPLWIDFPPVQLYLDNNNVPVDAEIKEDIPVGEYDLIMSWVNNNRPFANVYFNGNPYNVAGYPAMTYPDGTEKVQPNPVREDYDMPHVTRIMQNKNVSVAGQVYVYPIEPGGTVGTFRARVEFHRVGTANSKRLFMYLWAIRPSTNNY